MNSNQKKPWRIRHAFGLSTLIFSIVCMVSLCLAVAFSFNSILKILALPRLSAIMYLAAGGFFIGTACAALSVFIASYIISLALRTTVEKAIPLPLAKNWYSLTGPHAVVDFIKEKKLTVYISKTQSLQEQENLECGLLPLYSLPVFFPGARAMLRAFHEIYFDKEQLDAAFERELAGIHNAAPEKLLAYASEKQKIAEKSVRNELKEKGNRGYAGRFAALMKRNHFLTAHTLMVVKLTLYFADKWDKKKNRSEPIISHESIQTAEAGIRDAEPELTALLLEKCARNNPNLPEAMRDMFRYAMPDAMVHWPNGKSTLQELAKKHFKDTRIEDYSENSELEDESKNPV